MANGTIKIPALTGGVSKQPPHMRLPNQTETFTNAVPSVLDGCSKRPGSRYVCSPTLASGVTARMHAIHRDDSEKYLVLAQRDTSATIQVRTTAGTDCPVYISGASQTYLDTNSPSATDYRFVTIADYTMVGNTKVAMAADTSPSYTVTGTAYDYESLVSTTPTIGTYWRTRNDSVSYPEGYFQYSPGGNGYATIRFNQVTLALTSLGTNSPTERTYNPMGFSMFFSMGAFAQTNATFTNATRNLNKTSAFTNVSAGDWVNVTGGTGVTAAYYQIESKTDASNVILTTAIAAGNPTDVSFDGVGKVANVAVDLSTTTIAKMEDVAKEMEKAIRQALNGLEACVAWVPDTASGYFVVTSPYAGTSASFPATSPTRTLPAAYYPPHVSTVYDMSNTAGDYFYGGGSFIVTAGTGDAGPSVGVSVLERWVRKPAPNQPQAILDDATMPQQMVRLNPSGTYSGGYAQFTEDLRPFAYWRLGEATGTVAADEMGTNNGTYVATPTLGATGALNGDTNTAVTFNGTDEYVRIPSLLGSGDVAEQGFTFECWISTAQTTSDMLFSLGKSSGTNILRIVANNNFAGALDGALSVQLTDAAGLRLTGNTGDINFNTSTYHHLVITVKPSTNTVAVYLDGVSQSVAYSHQQTPASFDDFDGGAIAATIDTAGTATNFLAATLDEVAFFRGVMPAAFVAARYNQGANSSYSHNPLFGIFPTEWTPRFSGDEVTNPVPKAIEDGRKLSDIAFFRNRLAFGANENLFTSQDGDFFNLFLEDHDNIADSDPIQKSLSTRQVTIIDHLTDVRKSLLVTTRAGRQFELGTGTNETLTPTNGSLAQTTTKQTIQGVRPAVLDTYVYLPATRGSYSALYEYQSQESALISNANEVSAHVEKFLPTLTTVVACGNENYLLCLGSDSAIYAYRFFYRNEQKEMSSWSKWTFDASYTIRDIAVIGTDLYLLVKSGSIHTIERIALASVAAESGFAFVANMDRTFDSTQYSGAAFGGGNTTWTIPVSDSTINRVVTSAGVVHTATTVGTTVTVTGQNLAASTVLIGRSYETSVQLSRAYMRDGNGFAVLTTEVDHRETVLRYSGSGDFTVTLSKTGSSDRTSTLSIAAGTTASGEYRVNHVGNAKDCTLTITSSDVRPVNISSIDYVADLTSRSNP